MMEGSVINEEKNEIVNGKTKIFVAGASGSTGKRIVEQLLAKGFAVKAGVRDLDKAKSTFTENPNLQIFLMRLMGDESEVNLANGETEAEFSEWKWATPKEVIEQAVDYKRPTYEEVVKTFRPHFNLGKAAEYNLWYLSI